MVNTRLDVKEKPIIDNKKWKSLRTNGYGEGGREGEHGKSLLARVESARSRRMTTEGRVSRARKDERDLEARKIH